MENENTLDNNCETCSNNPLEIYLENACSCDEKILHKINRIPDEYFYNSCECDNCNCEPNENNNETICSCGFISNPLGMSSSDYSCNCNNIDLFN